MSGPTGIDADAACQAGMAAFRAGDAAAGLRVVDAARAICPDDARLWHMSGFLQRALHDHDAALVLCAKAAMLSPRDFGIAHLHARVALEAGLPSVELFERALRIERRDGAQLGLVEAIHAAHGPDAAIQRLDDLLRGDPGWIPGHAYLARLRCVAGDRGRLAASFERALAARPGDVFLWCELITTLMHAERFEEAIGAIGRAKAAAGPHPTFDADEAACLDELGDHRAAERLFAPFAESDEINLLVRRVRNLLRLGRPREAAALAEPRIAGDEAALVAPYLSIAWRMTADPRAGWLEADERLVGIYDLGSQLPELDALADRLRALHTGAEQPLEQSVRGGTQTEGILLLRVEPEIRALRAVLAEAMERHIAQLPPRDASHPTLKRERTTPVRFAGSWSVRLTEKGYHANHFHPEGWFSSAFYLALPPATADREGWLKLGEPQAELGLDLPATRLIEPRPGRLVLFPSTMWHGTTPFSSGERLSVAVDFAPPP